MQKAKFTFIGFSRIKELHLITELLSCLCPSDKAGGNLRHVYVAEASIITRNFAKYGKGIRRDDEHTLYRRNVYRKSQCMRGRTGQVSSLEISSMVMERGKNKWAMI